MERDKPNDKETEVSEATRSLVRTSAEASRPRPDNDLNTLRAFTAANARSPE